MSNNVNEQVPRSIRGNLVVIVGPTAVGKTATAIELARRFDGEIVNADSRNLYRGVDIGVAKPTADQQQQARHHLIDVLPPTGNSSLAEYQEAAYRAIEDILRRGKVPLLVGGTPLYVNSVVEGWTIPRVPPDSALRAELEAEAEQFGVESLAERLAAVDPVTAARSGRNLRRIIRGLEIYAATGEAMSNLEGKREPPYRALELWLSRDRATLHRLIDERVDEQIAQGLVREMRGLLEQGVPFSAPAMSSLGYRQLVPYFRGEQTLEAAIERIKFETHRYVRHQETWLRRNSRLIRIDVGEARGFERLVGLVENFLGLTPGS